MVRRTILLFILSNSKVEMDDTGFPPDEVEISFYPVKVMGACDRAIAFK